MMKRLTLLVCCCLMVLSAMANNPFKRGDMIYRSQHIDYLAKAKAGLQYKMCGYHSNDNYETTLFSYNSANQLVAVYEEVVGEYQVYDSLKYNTEGQMTHISGHQYLSGQWKEVYRVDYTYNSQGLLSSRTNYNYMSDQWMLGGVYNYNYNAQGQLTQTELTMSNAVVSRINYEYADNLLQRETEYVRDESNTLVAYLRTHYIYANSIISHDSSELNENNAWHFAGKSEYFYDANGNCTEFRKSDNFGNITGRSLYEFENREVSNTLIPYTPELDRPQVYTNHNLYTIEHWYTLDVDNVLQHACDYIYDYSGLNDIITAKQNNVKIYPNPTTQIFTIEGQEPALTIELFDLMGRQVLSQHMSGGIQSVNVAQLHNGTYIVKLHTTKGCTQSTIVVLH